MSKQISKSPEMLLKEKQIEELHKKLKKTRSTLKSLKTRLGNTQQNITDIQMKVSSQYFRMMEDVENLKEEIVGLLKKLLKLKNLASEEKKQLKNMMKDMAEPSFGEEYDEYRAQKEKKESNDFNFDDAQRAKMRDMFAEFRVKPDEEEQRNIRKIFIKLSTNFHPDKANNDEERELFHGLQQQINEAYQAGDIEKLLELDRVNLETDVLDFQSKAVTVDMLQQEIDRLNRELGYLQNQIDRTSQELKLLRKSDLGKILSDLKKAKKEGAGMDDMIEHMNEGIEHFTEIRDALFEAEKEKDLSVFYKLMASKMDESDFEEAGFDIDDLIEMMGGMEGGEETFFDMFGGMDVDFDREEVRNPKFEIGSSVRIKNSVKSKYAKKVDMKNWEGRVLNVYAEDGEEIYEIYFDSVTMNQNMPLSYIEKMIDWEKDFSEHEFALSDLAKSTPRDKEEEASFAYRKKLNQFQWQHLGKEQEQMMQEILDQYTEDGEPENWENYFRKNIPFPVELTSKGIYYFKEGDKVTAAKLGEWRDYGHTVLIQQGKKLEHYPLFDLTAKGEVGKILDLYFEWIREDLSSPF